MERREPVASVRPLPHLLWQGVIAILSFLIPVFSVSYFLTYPDGPWRAVIVLNVVALAALGLCVLGYYRTRVWASPGWVSERGFFGRHSDIPSKRIGSVVRVDSFQATGAESHNQLFVCDHEGRQILRMRGQYWARSDIDLIESTLGLPVTRVSEPMSTDELLEEHPGLLYWFERHPILAAAAFTAVAVGAAAVILVVLRMLGLGLF